MGATESQRLRGRGWPGDATGARADDIVREQLQRLAAVFDEPRVLQIKVRASTRMRSSLARAYLREAEVRVSVPVLSSLHLPEVLAHEVVHIVCWWRHGAVRPHGREWKDLMRLAGERPRACLDPLDIRLPPRRRRRRRRSLLPPGMTLRQARAFLRSLL